MNITLKRLIGNNIMGGTFDIEFSKNTTISGKNASGKTRIFNTFCWVLWGKNSNDVKDFSIKDRINTDRNRFDHEAVLIFDIDGVELILKKIYKERWTTKRGNPTPEFTGNETVYFYNDVPCSQNEYNGKVSALLSESIAKLITNPFAFNSLKWEQRREVLTKIAGDVNDSDISAGNKAFEALLALLNGKSLLDFKREIAAKKKKIREALDLIPARIDESGRSKPEPQDFDFIEKSIENKRKLITNLEIAISDKVKAHRGASLSVIQKQNDLNRLKMELQNLEAALKRDSQKQIQDAELNISVGERRIVNANSAIDSATTEINHLKTKIERLEKENEDNRAKWHTINKEVMPPMDADAVTCPACKQSLPEDKIEIIRADYEKNWNNDKQRRMAAITGQGNANNNLISSYKDEVSGYEKQISDNEEVIKHLVVDLEKMNAAKKRLVVSVEPTPEMISLKEKISNFVSEDAPVIDDAELRQRKTSLQTELNELVKKFAAKEQIEKTDARIKELETQERELSQEIADLERTEFTIDAFVKCKMDLIEARVNQLFKSVSFKMFSKNINGGIEACCDCFYKGVPFEDANNAGRINAGLEIINVLSGFYNVYSPVFVDNAESVNELYPLASQLITLVVTTEPLKIK